MGNKKVSSRSFMLATLVKEPFSDENWLFERKLDGVRCIAIKEGDQVTLLSRNGKRMNQSFPEIVAALKEERVSYFIVDGEIVSGKGKRESFSALQLRMHRRDPAKELLKKSSVHYYIFDLLEIGEQNLRNEPLIFRKKELKKQLKFSKRSHYLPHKLQSGVSFFNRCKKEGYEGVIAKKIQSAYQAKRSKNWLKFKVSIEEEFIIGGYTKPAGARKYLGALLLGYYEKNRLQYAGKVGTGFDKQMLKKLQELLRKEKRKEAPFSNPPEIQDAVYVEPKYSCRVVFTEWTNDKKLRHPSFLGLARKESS